MRFQTPCVPFLIFAFIVFANNTLSAQFRNELMLQTGDTSPVNGDVILGVGVSGINDHGEVLAVTSFSSINIGLMIADGQPLIQLVRTGDDTPSGNGQYSSFSTGLLNGGPFFNNQGAVGLLTTAINWRFLPS